MRNKLKKFEFPSNKLKIESFCWTYWFQLHQYFTLHTLYTNKLRSDLKQTATCAKSPTVQRQLKPLPRLTTKFVMARSTSDADWRVCHGPRPLWNILGGNRELQSHKFESNWRKTPVKFYNNKQHRSNKNGVYSNYIHTL